MNETRTREHSFVFRSKFVHVSFIFALCRPLQADYADICANRVDENHEIVHNTNEHSTNSMNMNERTIAEESGYFVHERTFRS